MQALETISPEQFIETELQKFDVTTEALRELVAPMQSLTIKGIEDKQGFIAVREARLTLKSKRVEIQNNGKALRANAVKFQKAVIAREDELIGILTSEEKRLAEEESNFEAQKERIRQENERKETERIQSRLNQLAKHNYAIDFYEAKVMSDEDFDKLLVNAQQEYNTEQERLAAEAAEQDRIRKAEEDRLKAERAELDRQRAEQAVKEKELQAERERQRKEIEAQQAQINADRAKMEQERRELELEQAKKEAAERGRIEAEQKAKREAEEKAEREREAIAEAKRQEALKPFKQKMTDFADRIQNMCLETPTSSQEKGAQLHSEVNDFLTKLSNHIKAKIKSL